VGRRTELKLLDELLDGIAQRVPGVLVIEGLAGQGKSCLLEWTAHTAKERGFTLVQTIGIEFEREQAFGALAAMLEPFRSRFDQLDERLSVALQTALGWEDGSTNRMAISTAIFSLLSGMASGPESSPVLVVVDDAHWVDQSSLEALASAAVRIRIDSRVGFLFAQRTGSVTRLDEVSIRHLELSGMDLEDVIDLLGDRGVAPAVAERCWAMTQGNPLALLEGVRGLSDAQKAGNRPLPRVLPAAGRLLALYRARLLLLPEATQRVLAVAAMAGDDLRVVMTAVTALGGHAGQFLPAERAGIVTILGGRLRWHHPLLHSAANQLVVGDPRRRMQRVLATALSAAGRHAEALLLLSESVSEPDEEIAAQLTDLGAAARRRGAPVEAARAFEEAVRLSTSTEARHRRLYLAAEAWWARGDHAHAVALIRPVIADVDDVATRAQMVTVLGMADVWVAGPTTAADELERHAQQITHQHPERAVHLLLHAVSASLLMLDISRADHLAAQAVSAAKAAGDPALQFGAGAIRALTKVFKGDSGPTSIDALEGFGRVAVAALALEAPDADMLAQLCAYGLVMTDRHPVAETLLREMTSTNVETSLLGPRVLAKVILAELLWRTGRWTASRGELTDLLNLQKAIGPRELIPATQAVAARVWAGFGGEENCRTEAAAALDVASDLRLHHIGAVAHSAIGLLELGAGRHSNAAEAFDHVASLARDVPEVGWLWWQGDAIEAFAGAGRHDDAFDLLEQLAAIALSTQRVWALGVVERAKGLLRCDDDPEDHFALALEQFRSIEAPFEEGRTLLARGVARRAAGEQKAGSRDLAAARSLFSRREMGARPWADQASAALGGAALGLLAQLTPAAREVAIAVAAGKTGKEVADLLHTSVRTVEWHLGKIYKDHGLRGRSELIALVLREADDPQHRQ
jgi:DNA-binding CsgD family transcriptional regulator